MLDDRFSYDGLLGATDRPKLVLELSVELTRRLRAAEDPEREGRALVEELRGLGHDLWSFDESDDFQLWCGDYVSPKQPWELVLEIHYQRGQLPYAAAAFQERSSTSR
jgi:hypothetical protein